MQLPSGYRVAVLATDGVEESELTEPLRALRDAGARVDIVSLARDDFHAFRHHDQTIRVPVDRLIGPDLKGEDYDAVLLPGGALNADTLRMNPDVQRFLREMDGAEKPLAVICHAPWELVSAGLARGRTLTSYHTIQDDIRNAGGNWMDQEVVVDDNWVTSRKPADLPAFIARMLDLFAQKRPLMSEEMRRSAARSRIA